MIVSGELPGIGTLQSPNPRFGVLAGPEALPASKPLSMTHRPSEQQTRRGRSYAGLLTQLVPCCCHWHLCLVPALSRRSGDVGSLLPPRSSRSKPRTPMSSLSATGVRVAVRPPKRRFISTVRGVRPHPRVVIVGAGFGGLQCAKALRGEPVDVVLVDRHNYHLFTPLLYQVASCLLNPSEITAPLRKVLPRRAERPVPPGRGGRRRLRGTARAPRRRRPCSTYDDVVLATGSATNYYGNDAIASNARSASRISARRCSSATTCSTASSARPRRPIPTERRRLLTFCIVGGGPTGVEYAGALAELVRLVLPHEYPELPPSRRAHRAARRRRPAAADVQAAAVAVRAARARAARRRRAHRRARRVGRRRTAS